MCPSVSDKFKVKNGFSNIYNGFFAKNEVTCIFTLKNEIFFLVKTRFFSKKNEILTVKK